MNRNKNVLRPGHYKHKQTKADNNYKSIENFQTELRWIKNPRDIQLHCMVLAHVSNNIISSNHYGSTWVMGIYYVNLVPINKCVQV